MPLTHKVITRIDLPHEPGAWIEVRMPSMSIRDAAKEARSKRAIAMIASMPQLPRQDTGGPAVELDVMDEYDWTVLLTACILLWSYPEQVTPENVGELDPETVRYLVNQLIPRETDDERKNGSNNSTARLKVMEGLLQNGS